MRLVSRRGEGFATAKTGSHQKAGQDYSMVECKVKFKVQYVD